jgi:hypothetical protein
MMTSAKSALRRLFWLGPLAVLLVSFIPKVVVAASGMIALMFLHVVAWR